MKTPKKRSMLNQSLSLGLSLPAFALVKTGKEKRIINVDDIKHFHPKSCKDFKKFHEYQLISGSPAMILMLGDTEDSINNSCANKRVKVPNAFFVTRTPEEEVSNRIEKRPSHIKPKKLDRVLKKKLSSMKDIFLHVHDQSSEHNASDIESDISDFKANEDPYNSRLSAYENDYTRINANEDNYIRVSESENDDIHIDSNEDNYKRLSESENDTHINKDDSHIYDDLSSNEENEFSKAIVFVDDDNSEIETENDTMTESDTMDNLRSKNCNLRQKLLAAKSEIQELKKEKQSLFKLNIEYQLRGLGRVDSLSSRTDEKESESGPNEFLSKHEEKIHLGNGVWVNETQWNTCLASQNESKFTKNLAVAIWGSVPLTSRSVSGVVSNRTKNAILEEARPALTPMKLATIKNCVRHFATSKGRDSGSQEAAVKGVNKALAEKISDLRRRILK